MVREFIQLDGNDDDDGTDEPEIGEISQLINQLINYSDGADTGNGTSSNGSSDNVNLGSSERTTARPSDFDYLKTIGKGSFGKVYLAVHKAEGKAYAVKVLGKAHIKKRNEVSINNESIK